MNAIPKSFLVGADYTDAKDDPEFYARSMLIKVPYGQSGGDALLFTNSINSVSKIKWQIQEDKLIGRVSFERIAGTDGQGKNTTTNGAADPTKPLGQNDGLVVYQFRIESQFDIRRGYNSGTGEENNVVEENTADRPWTQRDYVRVDFSKNLVTTAYDFDTLSLLGVYNAVDYAPLEFDIRNPEDPNAPQFDLDKGYFDVTNKLFANPKMIDFGGGFQFPGCMLPNLISGGTSPSGNCNPNELTIRHSFKRVVDTDYEPLDWDGQKFEAYGAFETEREGYARDYGLVDKSRRRYISRYNIWERSHHYTDATAMTGATACKVDDDCGAIGSVKGMSHCDTHHEKCTLPFKDRTAKPIVWHYSDGSPELYFDSTREATEEWDTAMRGAVVTAKYAECKRFTPDEDCGEVITGNFADEEDALYLVKEINACKRGDVQGTAPEACDALADQLGTTRNYSSAVVALAKAKPMVILCHSPVSDKDPKECGTVGTVARLGDLRFHLVSAIATPETDSPWGIMSDSNDPLTGEHIAASINIWTHVNDLFSRGLVDTLRYINNELKTEDVTDGKYINQWVEAARQSKSGSLTPLMGQDEIDKRVASVTGTTVEKMNAASAKSLVAKRNKNSQQAQLEKALIANLKKISQTKGSLDAPSVNQPLYQARMNLAKGTPLEAAIATPAMQQLASAGYGSVALDPATKVQATSIFQGLSPEVRHAFEQRREANLAARGACIMSQDMAATAPLGYAALGDILQEKFGKFNASEPAAVQAERADKMKDYLRRRAQYAVIAHEMGHSIALRHNFVSSSDAWNFRPQYWLLRTNAKKLSSTTCKDDGTSDGATCTDARWKDPVSQNERKNIIEMWAQSSTMEYPGEPTQDLLGLGSYDFGAARMFYGNAATVYTDSRFKNTGEAGTIAEAHQGDFGGLLGYRYGDFSAPIHYSGLDGTVNLIEKCTAVDAQSFKPVNWNDAKDGQWSQVIDGHVVTDESGKSTRCTMPKVDFVQWDTLKDTESNTHAHDANGRVRVPHGFASDNWADLGNIAVFRHDNGADLYETMQFWIAQQEVNHIFTNYRRGKRDFSIYGAFHRALGRYHEKMRDSAKAIGLYVTLARDTVTQYNSGDDPNAFVASILKQIAVDNTVASSIAFDHFAHVFSRPQPGEHGKIGKDDDVLRSTDGTGFANPPARIALSVANGVTGGFGTISLGGRPIENGLARDQGRDYNSEYTLNVGSYYEKAFTAMLFTESADNFISASRDDFVDPRFRSVSLADVFPDGFRRWIANNLTGDDAIKGVYARGTGGTGPQPADLDPNGYALLGQTSWWPTQGIETCFPTGEKLTCRDPFATTPIGPATGSGPVIDPQVGWEQQKFALLFSLIYLPENGRLNWVDQMDVWQTNAPELTTFDNRIEFHNPDGHIYVAKTFGTEVLYGKTVQKGIAARVLEYANELLQKAVVTAPIMKGTNIIGYKPVLDAAGNVQYKNAAGAVIANGTCQMSKDCTKMQNYAAVPKLMDEALSQLGWTRHVGELKGVY